MSTRPLTAREALFVARYRLHGNAALAAREAGYAAYHTNTTGSKLLHRPRIIAALRAQGMEIVLPPQKPGQPGEKRRPERIRRQGLTLRQERFVLEYLIDGNAAQAAIRAGLPAKNPAKAGSAMLHHGAVAREIERARAAAAARLAISADRVRGELAALAFASIADVAEWGAEGVSLKEKKDIAPPDRAAIAEFICEKTVAETADGARRITSRTLVRMHSKQRALDALAKHLGLYGSGARTIAAASGEKRDGNAILRERLLKIAQGGEPAAAGEKEKEKKE
jgi:phage terminase small subunit